MTDLFEVEARVRDDLRRIDLPAAPSVLHRHVTEVASRPAPSDADQVVAMPRRAARPAVVLAAAVVALVVLGALGVGAGLPRFETLPSSSASTTASAPAPTSNGSSHPALGPVVDGVPTAIDGRPVLRGDALRSALAAATDDSPVFAGGWFHQGRIAKPCPLILRPSPRFDLCMNSVELFDGALGLRATMIGTGDVGHGASALAYSSLRPVVLEVRTHDAACTPEVDKAMSCRQTPILFDVAWLGDSVTQPPAPSPAPTPPSTSLSRSEAVALAAERAPHGTLVCAVPALHSTAFGVLGPDGSDPWMWVVVFALGQEASALVAIDYQTGAFIQSETGSGRQTCP